MAAAERRAEEAGGVELQVHNARPGQDLELLVRRGFEVEHRSWKGAAGSSVLSEPGMLEYYCEQARRLGKSGQVELAFLEHRGQPIAFEYGLAARGTYYSYKVGYDPEFSDWKPGQLLRMKLLKWFHADPSRRLFDFVGPLTDATARWSTKAEPVGRLVVGSPSLVGRTLASGYRLWTRRRRLSGRAKQKDEPKLGVRSRNLAGTAQAV
jgi:CelD/BcsL family acetyltransferase involved in cellulose biosynthesis